MTTPTQTPQDVEQRLRELLEKYPKGSWYWPHGDLANLVQALPAILDELTRLREEVDQWRVNSRENKMIAESAEAEVTRLKGVVEGFTREYLQIKWSIPSGLMKPNLPLCHAVPSDELNKLRAALANVQAVKT